MFSKTFPNTIFKDFQWICRSKDQCFLQSQDSYAKVLILKKIAFSHGKIAKIKGSKGFNLIKNLQKDDQKNTKKHEDFQ